MLPASFPRSRSLLRVGAQRLPLSGTRTSFGEFLGAHAHAPIRPHGSAAAVDPHVQRRATTRTPPHMAAPHMAAPHRRLALEDTHPRLMTSLVGLLREHVATPAHTSAGDPAREAAGGAGAVEVETRLGTVSGGGDSGGPGGPRVAFRPGVSAAHWAHVLRMMQSTAGRAQWTHVPPALTVDARWVSVRAVKGAAGIAWEQKAPLGHVDVVVAGGPGGGFRVGVKTERPASDVFLKLETCGGKLPTWVRYRWRHSFVYGGAWRFDLTRVHEGPTDHAALIAPPTHEVEVECVAPATTFGPDVAYGVADLLAKTLDLIPGAALAPE